MFVCTFTITTYGTSGSELPPRAVGGFCRSVLSGHADTEAAFADRMQLEGMALRQILTSRFDADPKPYSCADTCDWSITKTGSVAEIVREIQAR